MEMGERPFSKSDFSNEKRYVYELGFWSAIAATVILAIAGITATAAIQPFATLVGFLATCSFLIVMSCVHSYAPEERKVFSLIGLSFAIIYATLISTNYFIQLTFVNQTTYDASMFDMTNTQSMMMVLEVLGYCFMGVATLFAAPALGSTKAEKVAKWLFVVNGILGILTPIGYVTLPIEILFVGLIGWDIIMPISTAALAYLFYQLKKGKA